MAQSVRNVESELDPSAMLRALRQRVADRSATAEQQGPGGVPALIVLRAIDPIIDAAGIVLWPRDLGGAFDRTAFNHQITAATRMLRTAEDLLAEEAR